MSGTAQPAPKPPTARPGLTFATADANEAHDRVRTTFAEHDLRMEGADLDFRMDVTPLPRLRMGFLTYGGKVTLVAPPMDSWYHLNLTVTGESAVTQTGRTVLARGGSGAVMMSPTAPLRISWSADAVQYAIRFPRDVLEAHVAKLTASRAIEPIRFDLGFTTTSPTGRSLLATAAFLRDEMARPDGLATMPTVQRELESALMTQILMVAPNQYTRLLTAETGLSGRRTRVRELIEAINDQPDAETSVADLAAQAGIGVRALHAAFQDLVGMPPLMYVRQVRLDRVHHELVSGSQRSVTDVAADWGFYHPGRFARQYRARFGELPSATVRWSRPRRR